MKTHLCLFQRIKENALLPWWGQCLVILLLGGFLAPAALGQTKTWDKTIGGGHGDVLAAAQQTRDSGYILGGSSFSGAGGDKTDENRGTCDAAFCSSDYWLVKVDAAGHKQWDKTYGGDKTDILVAVAQTQDGGYILGGYSNSGISGDKSEASRGSYDFWVLKLNAAGEKEWDRTLGGSQAEAFAALQQTSDGGYILGGAASSPAGGDKTEHSRGQNDYWLVKLDAAGNKVWDKTYGGSEEDKLAALQQTADGGYVLAGHAASGISGAKSEGLRGSFDYWLVKVDAAGHKQWDKTYGGDKTEILATVQQTADGGYALGGYSASAEGGDKSQAARGHNDFWVLKLNAAGEKEWDKTLGGSQAEVFVGLQQTPDGGFVLGGHSESEADGDKTAASKGLTDYWLVKLDAAGNKAWDKAFGSSGLDALAGVLQTREGGFLLAGWSEAGISGDKSQASQGNNDFWLVKLTDAVPPPQLFSFSPTQGLPGAVITLTGENLGTTSAVRFNGLKAKIEVVSDKEVKAIVPAAATSGKITVETAGGKVHNSPRFTVLQPEVYVFVPLQATVGTRVYLAGNRLGTANAIYFNGVKAASIKVYNHRSLSAVVPEGATTGPLKVTLAGGGHYTTKTSLIIDAPAPADEDRLVRMEAAAAAILPENGPAMAFPNPFQQQVSFRFTLTQPQPVTVKVYDLLGREVSALFAGRVQGRQTYQMAWQPAAQQPGGFYIIRLTTPGQVIQRKVLLVR